MKYLIFGSSGFVGKSLVSFLRSKGEEVIAVQRTGAEKYNVDITEKNSFTPLNEVSNVDIIINCASLLPDSTKRINDVAYLELLYRTNVIGAVNILNFAISKGIKSVINCSTLVVNNKPWPVPLNEDYIDYPSGLHTGYASSKLMQELMMNEVAVQNNIQLLHLRLSALYGREMKWQGILPLLIDKATNDEKITITNGNKVSFDFLFIDDLTLIIYIISKTENWKYNVINTASGQEVYLEELAKKIIDLSNSNSSLELAENNQQISRSLIDISLLKDLIGKEYKMTGIEEGIKNILLERNKTKECVI